MSYLVINSVTISNAKSTVRSVKYSSNCVVASVWIACINTERASYEDIQIMNMDNTSFSASSSSPTRPETADAPVLHDSMHTTKIDLSLKTAGPHSLVYDNLGPVLTTKKSSHTDTPQTDLPAELFEAVTDYLDDLNFFDSLRKQHSSFTSTTKSPRLFLIHALQKLSANPHYSSEDSDLLDNVQKTLSIQGQRRSGISSISPAFKRVDDVMWQEYDLWQALNAVKELRSRRGRYEHVDWTASCIETPMLEYCLKEAEAAERPGIRRHSATMYVPAVF